MKSWHYYCNCLNMNKPRSKRIVIFCICLLAVSASADTLLHRIIRQIGGEIPPPAPADTPATPAVSADTPPVSVDTPATPAGALPDGSLPSGSPPSGGLPDGSLPDGSLPNGSPPSGALPDGSLPSGALPDGSLPSGALPDGSLPSGALPDGSLPSGSPPSGALPDGSLPTGTSPDGSLPPGALPDGSLPQGASPDGSLPPGASPDGSLPPGASPDGSLPPGASPDGSLPPGASPDGSLPPGASPDGSLPPGALPGGSLPPGASPDGSLPPGASPDGSLPPGASPDGSLPPGALPGGSLPPGASPDGSLPPGSLPDGSPPSNSLNPDGSASTPSADDSATSVDNYPMPTESSDDSDYPIDPDMPPSKRNKKKRKMNCKLQNFKKLNKCCKAPAANFFSTDAISKCNRRKSLKLPSLVTDYVLNQYQDVDLNNTIDFEDPDTKEDLTSGACFVDCLFDKQELLQPNGALNKPLVKAYFISKAGESWTYKINTAVDDCRAKAAVFPIYKLVKQSSYRTTKCSLRPLLVLQCVKAQLIKNCPTSSFDSTTETCTKSLRALNTKCDVMNVLSMKKP